MNEKRLLIHINEIFATTEVIEIMKIIQILQ
jgi:hypothetical protein